MPFLRNAWYVVPWPDERLARSWRAASPASLSSSSVRRTARRSACRIAARIDDALELRIEDNGPGIPAENLAKVFEPLFTTKRQGTGLGMPTVKQIVEQHGGMIMLERAVGEFTRAVIRLPLA